jgi:predicted MPP superfamily phosphohydrolase
MRASQLAAVMLILAVIGFIYGVELIFLAVRITSTAIKSECPLLFCSRYFIIIHVLALIGIICFIDGLFIEPNWIEVKKIEIETAKVKNTKLRIVLFSDTHCETKPRNENKLVEIISSLKPDVIVFTGDSLNNPKALPLFKETLKRMNASLGKFAVRGNVDSEFLGRMDLFSETGFRELADETVEVKKEGELFCITGFNVPFPENFQAVLRNVPAGKFNILLYHYSDLAESLEGLNVDLYLSGHTHGGQIRLPFYGAVVTLSRFGKKYEAGMYTIGRTKLYVNRGIGLEIKPSPQVRFLCRPEITVFDIKPPKSGKGAAK